MRGYNALILCESAMIELIQESLDRRWHVSAPKVVAIYCIKESQTKKFEVTLQESEGEDD